MPQVRHLQHQGKQGGSPLLGTLGSVAGGIIGGALGGPPGAAAGSALGGAAVGALQGKSTGEIAGTAATGLAGSAAVKGLATDALAGSLADATTSGDILEMAGEPAPLVSPSGAGPLGVDPLQGYGQDQLPDYMKTNQVGNVMHASTGGPVPNKMGAPSTSKFNYSDTDMNTPNRLVEGFQYGPLASVEYKKTGGKVGESYKMSYHNPLANQTSNPLSTTTQDKG